jgi:hypothetical protein
MGLTNWNDASDNFSNTELVANFVALDEHDHTSGKGVQVPSGGLAANAVASTNIQASAVTTAKVQDGAITAAKLASTATAGSYGTVASAANIDVSTYSVVEVTGTTNITSVTAGSAGRRVSIIFRGILTFTDGSNLKLAGNFVTSADDVITLVSDGTNWHEAGRSAN